MDNSLILDSLATLLKDKMVQTKATGAPQGPYLHGAGGTWGVEGLERDVLSTHIDITGSLAAVLPVKVSNKTNPLFPYITGFIRSDQQEKDGVCDDPEEAGQMKTCILTTVFGRKEFRTRELEINRVGEIINRGEMDDLRLVNTPLIQQLGGIFQQRFGLSRNGALNAANEMNIRIMEMGVAFQRWICPQVYTGNPANSSAGGGYEEFMGLDLLISTTKVDAKTGQACPSLYSDIKDYNYVDVQDTNAPYNIVHVLTQMFRKLRRKAVQQRMQPVSLAFTMRSQLFDHIADVWACEYPAYRCQFTAESGNANAGLTINDFGGVRFRDEMKNGSYLLIDGVKVPVIQDDCISYETTADNAYVPNGGYSSDIYCVPLSIMGGRYQTMYWETKDYRGALNAVRDARASNWFWSDGGRYLWGLNYPVNWCITMIAKLEPRLILKVPQLAGRLTNVVFAPLQHWDDPLPSQDYWLDGGVPTGYPPTSPYSEYNLK
jgi:hypothetical protein